MPVQQAAWLSNGRSMLHCTEASAASWNTQSSPADRPIDRGRIDDVAFDHLDGVAEAGQVFQAARAEVIQHADAVAAGDEGLGNVRADEPGSARYEKSSHDDNGDYSATDGTRMKHGWERRRKRRLRCRSSVFDLCSIRGQLLLVVKTGNCSICNGN